MCGITGYFLPEAGRADHPATALDSGALLNHRGPDGFGTWHRRDRRVGLQHYRLAILELSNAGIQPMHSADGRYTVVFNGEVYNHLSLRRELATRGAAPQWRGHSDTETLLAAISFWGFESAIERTVGMFALVAYDHHKRRLLMARDRLGEKPLYYGWLNKAFVFASEPKALRALEPSAWRVSRAALAAYLRLGYVPGAQSIYEGMWRLPPAHCLSLDEASIASGQLPSAQPYWHPGLLSRQERGYSDPVRAMDEVDAVLGDAVQQQMVADVPLGILLSGGIDSSLVAALMRSRATGAVRSFSIGFAGVATDEAPHARRVAAHLGTEHTELYVTPDDVLAVVPELPGVYCEPFADSSQVPTLVVSRLARQHVTVALTGDGGDELFAGYDRYQRVTRGWRHLAWLPQPLRARAGALIARLPDTLLAQMPLATSPGRTGQQRADRIRKIAAVLGSADAAALNRALVTLWEPSELGLQQESPSSFTGELPDAGSLLEQLMVADTMTYLPDNLLVKVDRAAMATGLETRAPFLDHRVVELAWRIPPLMKLRGNEGKWLLRRLLERYLPRPLFDRPKQGFGLPLDKWLRGPLKIWADDLLSPDSLRTSGLVDPAPIRKRWEEHVDGKRNWQHSLWCVLMLQAWWQNAQQTPKALVKQAAYKNAAI